MFGCAKPSGYALRHHVSRLWTICWFYVGKGKFVQIKRKRLEAEFDKKNLQTALFFICTFWVKADVRVGFLVEFSGDSKLEIVKDKSSAWKSWKWRQKRRRRCHGKSKGTSLALITVDSRIGAKLSKAVVQTWEQYFKFDWYLGHIDRVWEKVSSQQIS